MSEPAQGDAWNPDQYARFRAERSQPFFDLLGLVRARPGMRVVDLGCGTGELTAEMHRRLTAREVAAEEPFRSELGGHVRRFSNLPPEGYAALLDRLGYPEQHVRLQVYVHHLPEREAVVEWVRGSLLTDYQRRLRPEAFDRF